MKGVIVGHRVPVYSRVLVPRVRAPRRREQYGDQFRFRQKRVCPPGYQFPVEVRGRFFEQVTRALVLRRREEAHVPVESLVIILAVEELNLLERVRARQIAAYRGMNGQKGVESGGAGFLRADYEEPGQLIAGLVP